MVPMLRCLYGPHVCCEMLMRFPCLLRDAYMILMFVARCLCGPHVCCEMHIRSSYLLRDAYTVPVFVARCLYAPHVCCELFLRIFLRKVLVETGKNYCLLTRSQVVTV